MRVNVGGRAAFVGTGGGHAADDARAVVFIHGAAHDHTVWVMPARYFARHGLRVLAPDLPSHGRSAGEPLTTIEAMADWLAALMDACDVASATIVGHSMGALVAHAFAVRHDARVRALALLGITSPMAVADKLLDAARNNDPAATLIANGWSHSARARLGGNPNPGFWMLGGGAALIARCREGVHYADLAACDAYRADFTAITAPTLVLVGDADQMTPARGGREIAAAMPNARLVALPGCGHAMLSEQPNQVLDALIGIV